MSAGDPECQTALRGDASRKYPRYNDFLLFQRRGNLQNRSKMSMPRTCVFREQDCDHYGPSNQLEQRTHVWAAAQAVWSLTCLIEHGTLRQQQRRDRLAVYCSPQHSPSYVSALVGEDCSWRAQITRPMLSRSPYGCTAVAAEAYKTNGYLSALTEWLLQGQECAAVFLI